jgi:hypothetical protein
VHLPASCGTQRTKSTQKHKRWQRGGWGRKRGGGGGRWKLATLSHKTVHTQNPLPPAESSCAFVPSPVAPMAKADQSTSEASPLSASTASRSLQGGRKAGRRGEAGGRHGGKKARPKRLGALPCGRAAGRGGGVAAADADPCQRPCTSCRGATSQQQQVITHKLVRLAHSPKQGAQV